MLPNTPDSATIELNDLGITFLQGHKIGLVLSGSNYPMFDVNLNNGGKMYEAGDSLSAQTLLFSTNSSPSVFEFATDRVVSGIEHEVLIDNNKMIVTPNPATNQLTVHCSEMQQNSSIILADILGNQLLYQSIGERISQVTISTEQLPAGVYLIKLQSTLGIITKTVQIIQ